MASSHMNANMNVYTTYHENVETTTVVEVEEIERDAKGDVVKRTVTTTKRTSRPATPPVTYGGGWVSSPSYPTYITYHNS